MVRSIITKEAVRKLTKTPVLSSHSGCRRPSPLYPAPGNPGVCASLAGSSDLRHHVVPLPVRLRSFEKRHFAQAQSVSAFFDRYLVNVGSTRSAGQQSSLKFHVFQYGETIEIAGVVSCGVINFIRPAG